MVVFSLVVPLSPRGRLERDIWGWTDLDLWTRSGRLGFLYLVLVEDFPIVPSAKTRKLMAKIRSPLGEARRKCSKNGVSGAVNSDGPGKAKRQGTSCPVVP